MQMSATFSPARNPEAQSPDNARLAVPIAVAYGDGIGPEIMTATLRILHAAGARLDITPVTIGAEVVKRGITSGIDEPTWKLLAKRKVFLKAPLATPQGGGMKSLNVTLRKTLGLYANVRPCQSLHPFVATRHPAMDVVIIRENEEDLYAGIEHRQTDDVYQCLKLITRQGCERIVRYAFEYARAHGRRKVTCMTKDNIMKMTDGLFHRVFDEVSLDYPDIAKEHLIVDIGAARLVDRPEDFDVVVLPNLYGDILSDITAQMSGSIGLAGSANIGHGGAMFEAIHGTAPDIAGQDVANPSGLLKAGIMMLHHVGQSDVATLVENAWLTTLERGIHTTDLFGSRSKTAVGTAAFAGALIDNLGQVPHSLPPASAAIGLAITLPIVKLKPRPADKETVGVDVFLNWRGGTPVVLASELNRLEAPRLRLQMITSRGVKVWPAGHSDTALTDHWRCRFMALDGGSIAQADIIGLLEQMRAAGLDFIKMETLCTFDDEPGYSLGQGQ